MGSNVRKTAFEQVCSKVGIRGRSRVGGGYEKCQEND